MPSQSLDKLWSSCNNSAAFIPFNPRLWPIRCKGSRLSSMWNLVLRLKVINCCFRLWAKWPLYTTKFRECQRILYFLNFFIKKNQSEAKSLKIQFFSKFENLFFEKFWNASLDTTIALGNFILRWSKTWSKASLPLPNLAVNKLIFRQVL